MDKNIREELLNASFSGRAFNPIQTYIPTANLIGLDKLIQEGKSIKSIKPEARGMIKRIKVNPFERAEEVKHENQL